MHRTSCDYSRMRKGDEIKLRGLTGRLLTTPKYVTTRRSGLFYADVLWEDGTQQKNLMICLKGLEWIPKR